MATASIFLPMPSWVPSQYESFSVTALGRFSTVQALLAQDNFEGSADFDRLHCTCILSASCQCCQGRALTGAPWSHRSHYYLDIAANGRQGHLLSLSGLFKMISAWSWNGQHSKLFWQIIRSTGFICLSHSIHVLAVAPPVVGAGKNYSIDASKRRSNAARNISQGF